MDVIKLINEQLTNPDTLRKLGKTVGAQPDQVQKVAQLGLPALLQALGNNAGTSSGAESLAGALEQHKDDNVDDIDGFLNNVNSNDGAKILQHAFAGKNDMVQNNLARQSGLQTGQVSGLMSMLAPLLLGALGNQKKAQNIDASGLSGMLSGVLGQAGNKGLMGMVTNLLDSDKDGDIMDDVGNLLKGFMKK
jgi:hypothetical protein